MGQFVVENAHNRIDPKKFGEGWDHVFICKNCELKKTDCECDQTTVVSDREESNGENK